MIFVHGWFNSTAESENLLRAVGFRWKIILYKKYLYIGLALRGRGYFAECGLQNAESCQGVICGKWSAERSANYPLSLFRTLQLKNSAFPRIAKLPFARIAQQMCNRCIPSWGPLKHEKNEKWFIGYSSSMPDCTWNETLKQEHTIQNYNTPVTHNFSVILLIWDCEVFQTDDMIWLWYCRVF